MTGTTKELSNLATIIAKIEKIDFPNKERYISELKKWIINSTDRNLKIKKNASLEKAHRKRQNVYCLDYGVNVGSEFNYFHFCVVIKEFEYTALVVPLSSEKEDDADWKKSGNLIVPIGEIEDMPNEKKSVYAMVNQMKAVSKQRLTDYYDKRSKKYCPMTLNENQMQIIFDSIADLTTQTIFHKKPSHETVDISE